MRNILNAPCAIYRFHPLGTLGIGAFVGFFLYYFQPFGTASAEFPYKDIFLAGYGFVVSGALLLLDFLLGSLVYKHLKEEDWTIGKQIPLMLFMVSVSIACCYFYLCWFFGYALSWSNFWGFFKLAMSIAVFPVILVILLAYIYQLQKNQTVAEQLNSQSTRMQNVPKVEEPITPKKMELFAENGKDSLSIPPNDLLYMQSADNYVEIIYQKDTEVKKEILRNTLQRLEKQIGITDILRCHRSYIINLSQVERVSGNAQGYKLHLKGEQGIVPVSRSKSKDILAALK